MLPEKSSRGHTDLIFGIEPPTCEKNSEQNLKNIKNTLLEISSDVWELFLEEKLVYVKKWQWRKFQKKMLKIGQNG
jgi:hypothetical protein